MHDSRIYLNSTIGQTIANKVAGTQFHLLGDAAYPLSDHLMKGYPRKGGELDEVKKQLGFFSRHLYKMHCQFGQMHKNFNRTLNRDRSGIERSYVGLKGKFRRLKFLYMRRLDLVPDVIITACCFHNFVIEMDGPPDETESGEDESSDEEIGPSESARNSAVHSGKVKRDRLASLMYF